MRDRPVDLIGLIPQHHRIRDANEGRPLEALLKLLAEEIRVVESDIDQLYDNWFIETCESWVIPYIAALLGARPMRDFGSGEAGLRSFIANTLGYRQAKGTAAAVEQLARDVTGWAVVGVEFFQKLIWSQNVNHVRPEALGTASIRDAEAARMAHGPFDAACHSAAAGAPCGFAGRYNIPNLGLFVWRLDAYPLGFLINEAAGYLGGPQARASSVGPGLRQFDPLGADRPLFNRPIADRSIAARVTEQVVPAALDRRLLHRDLNGLRDGIPGAGRWFGEQPALRIRLDGAEVPPTKLWSCNLETSDDGGGNISWRRPSGAGEVFFDPELGRISLHAADEDKAVETSHAYAAPFDIGGGPYDRTESWADWRGDFFPEGAALPWRIGVSARIEEQNDNPALGDIVVDSLMKAIQRWNGQAVPGSRGIIAIFDNATYADNLATPTRRIRIPPGARLAIVSAAWPLVGGGLAKQRADRVLSLIHRRAHVRSNIHVVGQAGNPDDEPGTLLIDGLLIEGEIAVQDGQLGLLDIRDSTVGAAAGGLAQGVSVVANNEALTIRLSRVISGPVSLGPATGGVVISGSIIGEDRTAGENPDTMALVVDAPEADLELAGSTLFGGCEVRSIEAENSLFIGRARASQRQRGCVRFCYAPRSSRVPRRYRCQPDLAIEAETLRLGGPPTPDESDRIARLMTPIFTASAYPASAFAQLALSCPKEILSGAFGGAEMGAGFASGEPFRRANLTDALNEYLPFGLVAVPIFVN
jgi:hypothetical protein